MSSLQVSNSFSASFFHSESTLLSTEPSTSSGSRETLLAHQSQTMIQASSQSSISIGNEKMSFSSSAEFSLQFSQTTEVVIGGHSQGVLNSEGSPSVLDSFLSGSSDSSGEDNSLFDPGSLSQQIFENNVALFDDFLEDNGNELTKENVKKFVDLMKESIPRGISQAGDRLAALDALGSGDEDSLDSVRSKVIDKLEKFQKSMLEKIDSGELNSPDDITFSELPGVKSSQPALSGDSAFGSAFQMEFSVQFMQVTELEIGRQASAKLQGDAPPTGNNPDAGGKANGQGESESGDQTLFEVDALAQGVFQANVDVLESFVNGQDGEISGDNVEDFVALMKQSIPEGFRQARDKMSEADLLDSDNGSTLEEALKKIMDKLDSLKEALVENVESKSSDNGQSGSESTPESESGQTEQAEADSSPETTNEQTATSESTESAEASETEEEASEQGESTDEDTVTAEAVEENPVNNLESDETGEVEKEDDPERKGRPEHSKGNRPEEVGPPEKVETEHSEEAEREEDSVRENVETNDDNRRRDDNGLHLGHYDPSGNVRARRKLSVSAQAPRALG
ncbi:MAG: hypothetical protein ABEJ65_02400 [bacterium]